LEKHEGDPTLNTSAVELKLQLRQAIKNRIKSGVVPYEGQWFPRETVREKVRQEQTRSKRHAIGLAVLYLISVFFALLTIQLIVGLVY
jgi:hypothetical protein